NARWYDADLGRFISEDPVADPNNPNLYSYTANNPLRWIDPTGFSLEDTWAAQDEADTANTSYFTESQLADMGYTSGSETDTNTGGTDGSPNSGSGDGTQNTQKGSAQPVQGVDPNKKPEGDTKNIADDQEKKKTEQMDKVVDKPKPSKDGQDKTQNKKETKDNKYKPVVEDKSKKNSNWEQRMKETFDIKDEKAREKAQGSLLEEKFSGFNYDPQKTTSLADQFKDYVNDLQNQNGKNTNKINWDTFKEGTKNMVGGLIEIIGGCVIINGTGGFAAALGGVGLLTDGVKSMSFGFVDTMRSFQGHETLKETIKSNMEDNILNSLVIDVVFGI
ncbi:MAG: hypothetical protein GX075_03945, partial [Firmicutes bacterium]|nr:hypothetical protein [Bacillota bacterium]